MLWKNRAMNEAALVHPAEGFEHSFPHPYRRFGHDPGRMSVENVVHRMNKTTAPTHDGGAPFAFVATFSKAGDSSVDALGNHCSEVRSALGLAFFEGLEHASFVVQKVFVA